MKGITDEVFTRFVELCEVLHISPLASSSLGDMLYEVYYEGYDQGYKDGLSKGDLRKAIDNWSKSIDKKD